jgi:membrane dipeptidase
MEGADPIVRVEDLDRWWNDGLRIVSLAWSGTRYAGGTGMPGGLTPVGRELLIAMREKGIVHDASHLAEQAFWEALELGHHALIASHANARSLLPPVPGHKADAPPDRHLSDDMIRAVALAGGVIGLVLVNDFLDSRWTWERRDVPVTLGQQVRAHLEHVAALAGWEAVGIGSDVDAGAGAEATPEELDSVADWTKIGELVPVEARDGVLGENWLRVLRAALPS